MISPALIGAVASAGHPVSQYRLFLSLFSTNVVIGTGVTESATNVVIGTGVTESATNVVIGTGVTASATNVVYS